MSVRVRDDRLDFPFWVRGDGRAATVTGDAHVRDLVEQVLFTAPGERVMLPEFGCGLLTLVFEPASEILLGSTQLLVRGSLQRWLGDLIDVLDVRIDFDEGRLTIELEYVRLVDGTESSLRIDGPGAAA